MSDDDRKMSSGDEFGLAAVFGFGTFCAGSIPVDQYNRATEAEAQYRDDLPGFLTKHHLDTECALRETAEGRSLEGQYTDVLEGKVTSSELQTCEAQVAEGELNTIQIESAALGGFGLVSAFVAAGVAGWLTHQGFVQRKAEANSNSPSDFDF